MAFFAEDKVVVAPRGSNKKKSSDRDAPKSPTLVPAGTDEAPAGAASSSTSAAPGDSSSQAQGMVSRSDPTSVSGARVLTRTWRCQSAPVLPRQPAPVLSSSPTLPSGNTRSQGQVAVSKPGYGSASTRGY